MIQIPYQCTAYNSERDLLALAFGSHLHICDLHQGTLAATSLLTEGEAADPKALSGPTILLECPAVQPRIPWPANPANADTAKEKLTKAGTDPAGLPSATEAMQATLVKGKMHVEPPANTSTDGQPGVTVTQPAPVAQTNSNVCAVTFSPDGAYLLAVRDDKVLYIWDTKQWQVVFAFCTLRRCHQACFTPDSRAFLVADKFGDVYRYQLDHCLSLPNGPVHNEFQDDQLLLGHVSMLLDMCVTPDMRYIVTADRDEKIRVSSYPNGYTIQSYCLAHQAFVTTVACVPTEQLLVSGGGDGLLILWQYISGTPAQIWQLPLLLEHLEVPAPSRVNVRKVRVQKDVAVICEGLGIVLVFQLTTTTAGHPTLCFHQLLKVDMVPLDLVFDKRGHLWVTGSPNLSSVIASPTAKAVQPLLQCLVPNPEDGSYQPLVTDQSSEDSMRRILELKTRAVDILPRMASLEELRKDPTREGPAQV
ncbi:WD repeat-containing protein 4 [Dispira simplex]|nr:WD repeat-containing protein 4 [Dispira simplex]